MAVSRKVTGASKGEGENLQSARIENVEAEEKKEKIWKKGWVGRRVWRK